MISGSCRNERRKPSANEGVSTPTSRCVKTDSAGSKRYSTGSSIVTTWRATVLFTWSSTAASVVDFPEPVGPLTMSRPDSRAAHSRSKSAGTPSESRSGISRLMRRSTAPRSPSRRCRFTRKRSPLPVDRLASWSDSPGTARQADQSASMSSVVSGAVSEANRLPSIRRTGALPSRRMTSDAPCRMARSRASSSSGEITCEDYHPPFCSVERIESSVRVPRMHVRRDTAAAPAQSARRCGQSSSGSRALRSRSMGW